ncbi:response regulator transcription factor [Nautilia sp.]
MKILIVEDEVNLANALREYLLKKGWRADVFYDGDICFYNFYDVIILDWMLPKRSGFEVLKEIRRDSDTPVIMLTAKDEVKNKVKALKCGADDYVTKPFDLEELEARIISVYRRSKNLSSNILKYGEIEIDTESKTVKYKGEENILKSKIYELLVLFIKNRNSFLSKGLIADELDIKDESNVIEVLIYNLRKVFGKDFIKTYRNLGYRLA